LINRIINDKKMKKQFYKKRNVILSQILICVFILIVCEEINGQEYNINTQNEECTIGVASGKATSDNRPLLWKTRDYSSAINNEVYYFTSDTYNFISVITAGQNSYSWMGVNEKGFAIINSLSYDLSIESSGYGNGSLMKKALSSCATVLDFEQLLDETNITGRQTRANFGVIDSTGAAKMIETSGSEYWIFDANDTIQTPEAYVLRTNFTLTGGGSTGVQRFNRTTKLISDFSSGDSLNYKSIIRHQMRDFSDQNSNPLSVPYPFSQYISEVPIGYIHPNISICRNSSVSASVIHGVLPGEKAKLSTMWTILGQPASSIAIPYWPVGNTPPEANGISTAPLCDLSLKIKDILFDDFYISQQNSELSFIDTYKLLDENGNGHWARIFPAEDSIFLAVEAKLETWRQQNIINWQELLNYESEMAKYGLASLQQAFNVLNIPTFVKFDKETNNNLSEFNNFPNPFNIQTTFQFNLQQSENISMHIYDIKGMLVKTLFDNKKFFNGMHSFTWNGYDNLNRPLPPGLYFAILQTTQKRYTHKCIMVN